MKKTLTVITCSVALGLCLGAETIPVNSFRYAGPYPVQKPFMVDEVNVKSKTFDYTSFLDADLSRNDLKNAKTISGDNLPVNQRGYALNWASFSFQNSGYVKAELKVEGLKNYRVYLDGKKIEGKSLSLSPSTHEIDIKYLSDPSVKETLSVSLETETEGRITINESPKHLYSMRDVLLGKRYSGISVSPNGDYMIVSYTTTFEGGKTSSESKVIEIASSKVVAQRNDRLSWMPVSNKYYYTNKTSEGNDLVAVDPMTSQEDVLARNIPAGSFQIAPTEDFLIYSQREEGPQEKPDVYQILKPDDRQPGYRSRSYASKYDLKSGMMQRLTYGYHNSRITDITNDGKYALLHVSEERLTQRPTTLFSLYLLNLETMEAETLVDKDGFMTNAQFSPDGTKVLLEGSPEAFGGIGANVKAGQTPSMYDYQMYVMEISSRKISPLTKDFNPNVQSAVWAKADGNIYFTAEDKDYICLFKLNPKNGKIEKLQTSEDLVNNFSISSEAGTLAYYGQSASNSDRLYTMDLKTKKGCLYEDLSAEILKDVELGECNAWTFKNDKGETVYSRFYLPPHFDASKKYPMIVNYYGGCSPTSRNFESRYPHHAYAALGYVVLVIAGPSGATGFGQEWSARHVNTAGEGPAQDIITGAQTFCKEHPYVNEKKVGIIGASYGGFMSQYIPTITDFFACSISHAGISDHTGYWGNGYWGYSYSEVSMANSYPWSDQDLYVKQSPIYRADKINTPILLIHGDADTNVPFSESIQMYAALQLLGKESAFVAVKDQNHHILDYSKRLQWQDTIWAWFAKYLQDDPAWWDSIYAPKSL